MIGNLTRLIHTLICDDRRYIYTDIHSNRIAATSCVAVVVLIGGISIVTYLYTVLILLYGNSHLYIIIQR